MTAPTDAPLTDEQIDEALKLCDAATPGPWTHDASDYRDSVLLEERDEDGRMPVAYDCDGDAAGFREANAAFIAAARTLLPQALRELKALRTQLAHLAESAGDDSCADFARKLNAERDALRARLAEAERGRDEARANAALEAQHHHHLRKERDEARAQLAEVTRERDDAREEAEAAEQSRKVAEDSCKWDVGFREGLNDAAEQIAAFVDDHHGGRDDDPHNIASDVVADIRAGAWRTK